MSINENYLATIWRKTLNLVLESGRIDDSLCQTFFTDSELRELNENKAVILVQRLFSKIIMEKELPIIQEYLTQIIGQNLPIEVYMESEVSPDKTKDFSFLKNELIQNYHFSNFIIGKSNAQAHVSALAVANNPGQLYNPLFIYGNSGLGKTHILHAIGNFVIHNYPHLKIGILQGVDFVNSVVTASKQGNLEEFKKELSNLDILLLDDIQFIAGKEKSHEIFFTIFNELVRKKKQICITCDRLPSEIKGLEDRIISRFNSGLKVNIESPTFETAINILKSKLEQYNEAGKFISEDALVYIATYFANDVRNLEGSLTRLIFYGINFCGDIEQIDAKVAAEALRNESIVTNKEREKSIKTIIKAVCEYYNLTKQMLISKNRTTTVATARHIAIYLSRKLLDMPYSKIGEEFGGRDHSTIMNSCYIVEKNMKAKELYRKAVNDIENKIKF